MAGFPVAVLRLAGLRVAASSLFWRIQLTGYRERHILKPGLTGWAQLNYSYGSSIEDAYEKQLYDMYYVKNHSLFLDCLILLHTVEVILFGKGAR